MYILNLSHLWICTQSCLLDVIRALLNQMYSIPQFYCMDTSCGKQLRWWLVHITNIMKGANDGSHS